MKAVWNEFIIVLCGMFSAIPKTSLPGEASKQSHCQVFLDL